MRESIVRRSFVSAAAFVALTVFAGQACREATPVPSAEPSAAAPSAPQPSDALATFKSGSEAIIASYLREQPIRRLQIGAGSSRRPGWLNTDIEPGAGLAFLDATQRFPFEDGSLHYIFSEHVLEHLTYDEGKAMMAEAYRVLAPGGKMRISTPDLARFIDLFDEHPSEDAKAYVVGKMQWHDWPNEPNPAAIILNLQMSSWGHKFMYDLATLGGALTRAGFGNVREFEQNISSDEQLRDLEERDSGVNARWNDYETMSVEAEKPRTATTR
ncbi:MAG: methyltransferase domain-containing protein [Vicinamibacterales bacterium]